MSVNNKISASLNDADKQATLTLLQQAEDKMPFLISTPIGERPTRTMGAKSIEYVSLCLEGAKKYPNKMTVDFNVLEFEKDVDLIDQLWGIRIATADLLNKIDDTMSAASGDAMITADEVYKFLKTAAKKDGSVRDLTDKIAQRYAAQSRPRAVKVVKAEEIIAEKEL